MGKISLQFPNPFVRHPGMYWMEEAAITARNSKPLMGYQCMVFNLPCMQDAYYHCAGYCNHLVTTASGLILITWKCSLALSSFHLKPLFNLALALIRLRIYKTSWRLFFRISVTVWVCSNRSSTPIELHCWQRLIHGQ